MDQIVQLVQQKTGISEDQARTAVTTVLDFVKAKLPAPIAGQVDGVLGSSEAGSALGQASSMLGGMFGGDKK